MKKFNQRFLFFVAFCFVLSVISVTAQKNKTSPDDIPSPPEKVEVKSDPPPAPEPTKSEPSTSSSSSPSYSSSSDTSDSPTPTNRVERTRIRNERRQRARRNRQRAEIERRRREAAEEDRRKKRKKKDKKYEDCPTYETYGDCYNYIDDEDGYSSNSARPSWGDFYNENDIYFNDYNFYVDSVTANYSPFFSTTLGANYAPLHRVAVFEHITTVNYIAGNWVFYYEPDLDFMHINFEQIDQKSKFEKIVINAVGKKTTKKVGKRFKQKRTNRPVVVEDISFIPLDRIYVLNLNRLPKGTYEMKLLSRNGDTIKLPFTIK